MNRTKVTPSPTAASGTPRGSPSMQVISLPGYYTDILTDRYFQHVSKSLDLMYLQSHTCILMNLADQMIYMYYIWFVYPLVSWQKKNLIFVIHF